MDSSVNRLLVMTVGKTHSGKSTFAQTLKRHLGNTCVVDQDNHAEFINTYYRELLPKQGPNTLKYSVTETIVEYAVTQTKMHLVLCNAYRSLADRTKLLNKFKGLGFTTVLVNFDIPDELLMARISRTKRSTTVFRSVSSFTEVLARQQSESTRMDMASPKEDEADYFFVIDSDEASQTTVGNILSVVRPQHKVLARAINEG